ncbi:hypothetical protein T31B1_08603 [Salinisphaera sp. T31B1]
MYGHALAADGLIQRQSPYSVDQTVARFVERAEDKGLTIFATVDHAAGAQTAGLSLRPTTVVIFGNPKGGTPFMQCAQTVGIDLPLKALIYRDANGQVWLSYNDPDYIAKRHDVDDCAAVAPITKALAGLAEATVARGDD